MDILPVLKDIFYSENLKFFEAKIDETSKKSFHLGSNLVFAKVSIIDEHENAREISLAVKIGKIKIDSSMVARACRESVFFREIVPLFNNLQAELKIKNVFNKIPKCYKTLIKDGYEILILENLLFSGWNLLENYKKINVEGQELIAKNIAQYHALSFALRHLDKQTFDKHTKDLNMINKENLTNLIDVAQGVFCKIENSLEEFNKQETLLKFRKLMKTVNGQTMVNILDDKPKEVVVVHGDFHKFNLMYKFKDISCESISDAMFIDFQVVGIHSPILDLTYYFFTSVDIPYKALDFLKCYHEQLAISLKELTCDVNELFSYSTLLEHWNKYAFYGFCFASSFKKLEFIEGGWENEANDTIESVEGSAHIGKDIKDKMINAEVINNEQYKLALINFTEKYLDSINI
ncbi:uncharacterized protein [Diabrotica undecimpunctata]|uniref:uncharacterized protein n=1 Tax=Diabrotica undecimpunctata TaxID=50387 RepID=UPI003B633367